tara:strand:+ start:8991 stop:9665 length:675 start_codon:yes stop_codon:yes gene_type:complete
MKKENSFFLWLFLFVFLTTFSFNSSQKKTSSFLPIKLIEVEGVNNSDKEEILKRLNKFYGKSIIFISRDQLKESVYKLQFVKEIRAKKIYPDKIRLIIIEYKPIGIFINKNKKIIITNGGELIENYQGNKFKNLPLVFGNDAEKNFSTFYRSLERLDFQIELIKQFNYFNINRWDVVLKDDKVVKLPTKNYENSLAKFLSIYKKNNFSNFKVFDFRIKGQLILK